jgi:hypothetical protein
MAGRFGSIFVLALAQSAEARSPYDSEAYATPAMRADEKVHFEVVRGSPRVVGASSPGPSAPRCSARTTVS